MRMCGSVTRLFLRATVVTLELNQYQALVYDILPSTTAVFSYAIGSRKRSANEQFFCWCANSSKFVTNSSYKTRRAVYNHQQSLHHTPSIAFRNLPPDSARFSYTTEGALFISAQLSTDAVSSLRKVRVLIRLWKQPGAQART